MKAVRLSIQGTVQGVGYRDWAVFAAREVGVSGWVRNEPDGSVAAHAEGSDSGVETFVVRCQNGPVSAKVFSIDRTESSPQGFSRFERTGH